MKWSIGRTLGVGFGIALAILIILGVILFNTITGLLDNAAQAAIPLRLPELDGRLFAAEGREASRPEHATGFSVTNDPNTTNRAR